MSLWRFFVQKKMRGQGAAGRGPAATGNWTKDQQRLSGSGIDHPWLEGKSPEETKRILKWREV